MRDTDRNRSAVFRQGYWFRVSELVAIMTKPAQSQALVSAEQNRLGKKAMQSMTATAGRSHGPLDIDAADKIAKRYALWWTRMRFEWGQPLRGAPEPAPRIHEQITQGIWALDVELRRDVEELLSSGRQDTERAAHLQSLVAAAAGSLAATLDVGLSMPWRHSDWQLVADDFEAVCNGLDWLLTVAGAPSS